jgi:beta-lactamase superfamily II metal-dependent hydrolase
MKQIRKTFAASLLTGALLGAGAAGAQEAPLKIVAIDVEGGTATLVVTPQGRSLLFDAGWPPGRGITAPAKDAPPPVVPAPGNAERIIAQAKLLGLKKIDYLITTHYHVDHIGGVLDLASKFPVGTYVDHGANRELLSAQAKSMGPNSPIALYDAYIKAITGKPHREMKAGDKLQVDGLLLTAVTSDEKFAKAPGAGQPGVDCDQVRPHAENDEIENQNALGVVATYGKARMALLSDQVWRIENALVCPVNLVGKVDLAFVNNHGTDTSTSPVYLRNIKPTVMVMANGTQKGAGPETLKNLHDAGMDVWQIHFAVRSPDLNYPADQIANIDPTPLANNPLHINVAKSGAITVINPRNGFNKTYPKAP